MASRKLWVNKTERRTLRLALDLAGRWEATLADSNDSGGKIGREQARTIRECLSNIKKFEALRDRIGVE